MAKSSKKKKQRYLELLSENLRFFYPKLSNIFMCPVCFKKIDLKNKNEISDAHIIPKAAGGNRKTFLCRKCNSDFGSKQDKWFGELIRLTESKENIVQTQIKEDSFSLCNKKVRGRFEYTPEKGMEVLIHKDRNPPEVNDYVLNQFLKEKNKTSAIIHRLISIQDLKIICEISICYANNDYLNVYQINALIYFSKMSHYIIAFWYVNQ